MARTSVTQDVAPPVWTVSFSGEFEPEHDNSESGQITITGGGVSNFPNVVNDDLALAIRDLLLTYPDVVNVDIPVVEKTTTNGRVVPDEPEIV